MSDMFKKYFNIDPNYIPNNMDFKKHQRERSYNRDNLIAIIDRFNQIWGYTWSWKDTVSIPITINKIVNVPDDSIIVNESGIIPTNLTEGKIGQKFYNVVDIKSWTCKDIDVDDDTHVSYYGWIEDDYLKYVDHSNTEITIEPDISGKKLTAEILNFRKEIVYSKEFDDGESFNNLDIDLELSNKLVPGIYFVRVRLVSDTTSSFVDEYKVFINIETDWKSINYHKVMSNTLPYIDIATASDWAYEVIGEHLSIFKQ